VSSFSKLRSKFLNEETTNTKKKGLQKACYLSSRNKCNRLTMLCTNSTAYVYDVIFLWYTDVHIRFAARVQNKMWHNCAF